MKSKLDPDGLGIILLPLFLEEFYPEDKPLPDSFTLYHYNGLSKADSQSVSFIKGSCFRCYGEGKEGILTVYIAGEAVMLEGVAGLADNNAILQTLQTKWRNIAVDWTDGAKPSIN